MQGAYLRDRLAARYVSIGVTFHHGSFNAYGVTGELGPVTVGSADPGSNEYILDWVALRDYVLDLRSAPPPARLAPRGTTYPLDRHRLAGAGQAGLARQDLRHHGPPAPRSGSSRPPGVAG
ncbi:erythromycin esterase family protein [Cryptosporangium aurantiacum]|uniref:erythromycin esterase family protein n=1 Tax=Cryptosporangium aurantiacum TaxID=134849 RepID=UPI000933EB80|nr:erythromycin esterase family protein [Cryptosporangium aurantiacum]